LKNTNGSDEDFVFDLNHLLSLCSGESIAIGRADIRTFLEIARELENEELISKLLSQKSVSVGNVVMRFEFCPLDSDIEFAIANFCSLDFSSIGQIYD
jgi:hypothetical protein